MFKLHHPPRPHRPPLPAGRRRSVVATADRHIEVGLIPGTRFFLFPLKKVTAVMRPHTPCREPSATKTKPCIVSKSKSKSQLSSQGFSTDPMHRESLIREWNYARRSSAGLKRGTTTRAQHQLRRGRKSQVMVAKTRLSPVCEASGVTSFVGEPEVLQMEYGSWLWNDRGLVVEMRSARDRDMSIFTLSERPLFASHRGHSVATSSAQKLHELSVDTTSKQQKKRRSSSFSHNPDRDSILHRNSRKTRYGEGISTERECQVPGGGRSFGRNNRVSPSSPTLTSQQLHPERRTGNRCSASFDELEMTWNESQSRYSYLDSRGTNCTKSSSKAQGLVPELEEPWNIKNRSHFRRNGTTKSFDKGDELVTLCDKNRSTYRGHKHSATSFDKADELVKQCEKNRRKSKGSRRTSFDNADETLCRDKKRSLSFGRCLHQIRSRSPFLCSFTNENDLPVGPQPRQLSRRLQN